MTGAFRPFDQVKVTKAFLSLAPKKAPGPDGLLVDLLRSLPRLVAPITILFSAIFKTGHFPAMLLKIYVSLLDKPNRPPDQCKATRPISLISVLSQALETAVLNRLIATLEEQLVDCQYTYRRSRGTGHHLLELRDSAREMRL